MPTSTKSGTAENATSCLHTPGPWKARDYATEAGDIWIDCDSWKSRNRRGVRTNCAGGTLATAHASGCGDGTVEANARLIAAAPRLLDACSEAYSTLIDVLNRLEQLRVQHIYHEQRFTDLVGHAAQLLREVELEAVNGNS